VRVIGTQAWGPLNTAAGNYNPAITPTRCTFAGLETITGLILLTKMIAPTRG
jgi:hypothetical protein